MRALTLGLDVGTQSTKALVVDVERHLVVGRGAVATDLIAGLPEGAAEQDPATWIGAVRGAATAALGAASAEAQEVQAVGVSGQQHGLVALDAEDRPVRPAPLWCDLRADGEAAELSRALGRAIPAGFTAPKILWMKRREPERWERVRRVLLPHDYVNLRLTGQATMEAGDASGTGLLDAVTRRWDAEAMSLVDARLPALLPETLITPGEPAGRLSSAGAALLGLRPGTPVSAGSGDNMMSAIGAGATRPGVMVVSLGTSGTAFAFSAAPIVDREGLVAPFCDATGGYLPLVCVMNMTAVVDDVRALVGGQHAALAEAAARVPAGCDGLLLLPYLSGERVPNLPHATGALVGLRHAHLRPEILYRAALEGTTLNLGLGIARMKRLGITPSSVRVAGGGARNPLWRQILADVLGLPVQALAEVESAALGAAIQAAWTLRRVAGDPVTADEVAAPFVHADGAALAPQPAAHLVYQGAAARLGATTDALFRA